MAKSVAAFDSASPLQPRPVLAAAAPWDKFSAAVKNYLQLTKTGIVFGNLISVMGGFFMAARGHVDLALFFATIIGLSLVVASGCVFNNVIDRDIDGKMRRTQNRVLVRGLVAPRAALFFAAMLGLGGLVLLAVAVNPLCAALAILGFAVYVGIYSLSMKRSSVFGTLVGSLSGAMPPVIGYCAVTGQFDLAAALLLLIFCLWQMPHSYAIAIVYLQDYAAAGIPVLPVQLGVATGKKRILYYIPVFTIAALLLTVSGYTGYWYLAVMGLFGFAWLWVGLSGYRTMENKIWARKMFAFSIIAVMALSLMMAIDYKT